MMDIKKTKIVIGFLTCIVGILLLVVGAAQDNGSLVSTGSFLFSMGFGYLMGSA